MRHLRFTKVSGDRDIEVNFTCRNYEVNRSNGSAIIHMFDKAGQEPLSTMRLAPDDYTVCFVMNDDGKTIDRIGPYHP